MKCLVIGGNGFIGCNLTRALQAEGHEVSVYGHKNKIFNLSFLHGNSPQFFEGDFQDHKYLRKCLAGMDVVFHLVSTTLPSTSNNNPIYDAESNIIGTLELLESIVQSEVQKTIFISSGGTVYGKPEYIPINEKHPTNPDCSYGISKLAIEKYFSLFEQLHQLDHTVLRVSNPYGEYQNPLAYQGVVAVFTYKMLTGQEITIWGDGSITRDYVYIQDVCQAMIKAITKQSDKKIINIGSGQGHTLNDIVEAISETLQIKPKVKYTDARTFDVPVNVLDVQLAKQTLGWEAKHSLIDGILKTATWYQQLLSKYPEQLNQLNNM